VANPLPDLDPEIEQRIERIRSFNRMYMHRIGVLAEKIFGSSYSLAEVRVLNELSFRKSVTASILCRDLRMDGGYISRILQGFEREGLITKERSKRDGRQRTIHLTRKGRLVSDSILAEAKRKVLDMLAPVAPQDQQRLIDAMNTIDEIINANINAAVLEGDKWELRPHRPGDMGLIIHSHAIQFAEDYGWNEEFEALVAEKTAEFIRNFNPARERCWLAEHNGKMVGSLCLVHVKEDVAELRLPFVTSEVRNLGIGKIMLAEAIRFARHVGYKKLTMWTESIHDHARDLFEDEGLRIMREIQHHRFGKDLIGQHWEMEL
jgi:DNA-binding MarR family transcriptional regulator/GNAT superfamily N-acetyltransferase